MKIALVHDYLIQRGGAERVFELICGFFPEADIYTSVYSSDYSPGKETVFTRRKVNTSFLQSVPGVKGNFRLFAPLYYPAFRALDLLDYDLILSSSTSFAKGVRKKPGAMHICFCHNITRFLWDSRTYMEENSSFKRFSPFIKLLFNFMRKKDLLYSQEPDLYIANSTIVGSRILDTYKRKALVVNYPIDVNKFIFSNQKDEYYLISSRMISYKRLDIAIEAFNWLGLPLVIIGDGPERQQLESKALQNVTFLGYVSDEMRASLMAQARGVVVTALEDYGLVPVEANVSGTPVIAYGAGGVLDTQVNGLTGILFKSQSPEALQGAIRSAESKAWNYTAIRAHALKNFSETVFINKIARIVREFCGKSSLEALNLNLDLEAVSGKN